VTCIAILAAMPSELRPVVRALRLRKTQIGTEMTAYRGVLVGQEVLGMTVGIGPDQARRATERLLGAAEVDRVVVIGIAGGVGAQATIGELVVPEEVVDARANTRHKPNPIGDLPARGVLWTCDQLILDLTVHDDLRERDVVALDMETAAIAEVCERSGCSWSVVRAISDRTADGLIDEHMLELTRPDGRPNMPNVLRRLVRHPTDVVRLARLGRDAKRAADASARAALAALGG
jgi:adenosylhomocysteine nucleosidase